MACRAAPSPLLPPSTPRFSESRAVAGEPPRTGGLCGGAAAEARFRGRGFVTPDEPAVHARDRERAGVVAGIARLVRCSGASAWPDRGDRVRTITSVAELRTARLDLRQWRAGDLDDFAALNSDPEVMAYFPSVLSRRESDALAERCQAQLAEGGWGLWAVEVVRSRSFIGFVGLSEPRFKAPFLPATEIGWRLGRSHWGRGYASEAARAAACFAFAELALAEIVSFTAAGNLRSRRVMERLEMSHDPSDDFDHPLIDDPELRRHVLYRLPRRPAAAG